MLKFKMVNISQKSVLIYLLYLAKTDIQVLQNNVQTILQTIVKTQELCSNLISNNIKGINLVITNVILTKNSYPNI